MPHKYAKSARQHEKERRDKARKREAKKARQSLERTRVYTDARLENEPKAGAEDTTLFNASSAKPSASYDY